MKILSIITILSLAFAPIVWSNLTYAQEEVPPEPPTNLLGCNPNDPIGICLMKIAKTILRLLMILALILAAIFIAVGGFIFITKGAEKEGQQKAQKYIIYAAVGLIVAFVAWALALLVSRFAQTGQI